MIMPVNNKQKMSNMILRLFLLNSFLAFCLTVSLTTVIFIRENSHAKSSFAVTLMTAVITIVTSCFLSIGNKIIDLVRRPVSRGQDGCSNHMRERVQKQVRTPAGAGVLSHNHPPMRLPHPFCFAQGRRLAFLATGWALTITAGSKTGLRKLFNPRPAPRPAAHLPLLPVQCGGLPSLQQQISCRRNSRSLQSRESSVAAKA